MPAGDMEGKSPGEQCAWGAERLVGSESNGASRLGGSAPGGSAPGGQSMRLGGSRVAVQENKRH